MAGIGDYSKKTTGNRGYKMKGNPMQRNFGIGGPLRYEKDPTEFESRQKNNPAVGPKNKSTKTDKDNKTTEKTKGKNVEVKEDKIQPQAEKTKTIKTEKTQKESQGDEAKGKTDKKTEKTKTRKKGWFGLYDMGITEAFDAMTKVRNRPKE
jgi:hypothetical protein